MRKTFLFLALAGAVVLSPVSLPAQRVPVRGHIIGEDGKPLAGAEVVLVNKDNGQKFSMKTDQNGDYLNIGVVLGVYHVTVSKDGKLLFQKDLTVNGEEKTADIDISKAKEESRQEKLKQLTPEQRKELEDQQKAAEAERVKITNLNQILADARTAESAGDYDQAIVLYKRGTELDPTQHLLWARLGAAYLTVANKLPPGDRATANDDYGQAVEAYKKAIAIKGSEAAYHNNIGQAYGKLGKADDAMAEYTVAAQMDPSNASLYFYNLGAILTNSATRMTDEKEKNHTLDEANAAFDKAIAANPNRPEPYYQKALNLLNRATVGKDNKIIAPPGTAEALNKYLELAPNGPNAPEAKELLASIGAKVETTYQKKK